jgi:excisionase family DNA binding protein
MSRVLPPLQRRYVSIADGSLYTGLSGETLRRAVRNGDLRGHRPLGRGPILLDLRELDAWVRRPAEQEPESVA